MSAPFHNLAGQRFGRLVVLYLDQSGRASTWMCLCDCGNEKIIRRSSLVMGDTKSCGCLAAERAAARMAGNNHAVKHGMHGTSIYVRWACMMDRCYRPNNAQWKDYGGRGITVDPRWHVFENFYADMGDPPDGLTLDRKDNDLGYSKSNCRWATRSEQNKNKRYP